ncbi:glycosyltransferase family 39 protein [Chitinophaga sp. CF418]|uniref:ArnT family glycosyltransferase n=1 Tax=Chitinophaga sp. CF418 TaxID=1855287 RepID=UPI000917AFB7|nr:glycosyltransferase family 39 protein [Chitinophaga sp. CF418]SHM57415.1 Dolichyl-phosphate-mannose-protein mannosyltransferase [Chitinophaga sp. CF418]
MPRRSYLLLILFLLFKLVFHFLIVHPAYDLHRDEFLHLDQANHLAAGYLSVPPFTAFLSLLIKWLGGGVFWVRFFPALFGALTMLVIWKLIELLKGGWYAQIFAAVVFICSAMSRINMLYQPNSFDVFSWTLVFYLLILYIKNEASYLLLWLGAVIGLAFLNKYNILFLAVGLLPALLISSQRKIFLNKYLYGGLLIALLLATPNVIWQIRNGMPVIHHMKELASTQLVNVARSGFMIEQLLFFLFGTLVWGAALAGFARYESFKPYRFIGWAFLFVMALFVYLRAKPYYALGLYPVLIAFGSVYWEHIFSKRRSLNAWLRWLCLPLIMAPTLLLFRMIFPVMEPHNLERSMNERRREIFAKWEDGKVHSMPQDFADMLGWRELAGLVVQAYEKVPMNERRNTLILCDNYGQAGAINYYAGREVSPAITFNADYVFWFPPNDTLHYLIIVGDGLGEHVRKYASAYTKTGQISHPLAREYGTGVYFVQGISPLFPGKLKQWQLEEQASFRAWK